MPCFKAKTILYKKVEFIFEIGTDRKISMDRYTKKTVTDRYNTLMQVVSGGHLPTKSEFESYVTEYVLYSVGSPVLEVGIRKHQVYRFRHVVSCGFLKASQ